MVTEGNNKGKRKSQGRRKIEIKKIENMNRLQVTFSKRRAGLFSKASELALLTGAEIAIFVQSTRGKIFSFGHPSVDTVIDKFLNQDNSEKKPTCDSPSCTREDVKRYVEELKKLEAEKEKLNEMNEKVEAKGKNNVGFWWEKDINVMGVEELVQFMKALEQFKTWVNRKADEKGMARASSISSFLALNPTIDPRTVLENYGGDGATACIPYGFHFGPGQF